MKQSTDTKKKASSFLRYSEENMNLMESISNQDKYIEDEGLDTSLDYVDDDGIFEMDHIIDVTPSDRDDAQVPMWNSPMPELSDGDKSLIVEEFANTLSKMHEEVIDFSDIGPIATVIQNKFGFKQNLEDFLTDLITTSADRQDSQAFAKSHDSIEGGDSPVDIQPKTTGLTNETSDIVDMPVEQSVDMPVEQSMDMPVEQSMDDSMDTEISNETLENTSNELPNEENMVEEPISEPVKDTINEPNTDSMDIPVEESSAVDIDDIEFEDDEKLLDEELDTQLESIKNAYFAKVGVKSLVESIAKRSQNQASSLVESIAQKAKSELTVDEKLNKIKSSILESSNKKQNARLENEELDIDDELANDELLNDDVMMEGKQRKTSMDDKKNTCSVDSNKKSLKDVDTKLEAIASKYKAKQKAQLEAIHKEKMLEAKLESIASNYKKTIQREKSIDEKLSSLVESYQQSKKQSPVKEMIKQKM